MESIAFQLDKSPKKVLKAGNPGFIPKGRLSCKTNRYAQL